MADCYVETLDKNFKVKDIDASYLMGIVQQMGYPFSVKQFGYELLNGPSYGGAIYRFHLSFQKRDQLKDTVSVILKETRPANLHFDDINYSYRELNGHQYRLFSELKKDLIIPLVYKLQIDKINQRCWIWMKDYQQSFALDWTSSMVLNTVKHLAELYAVWWGREQELYQYGFLAKYGQGMYHKNWAKRLIKNCRLIYEHPDNQKILQTFTLSRQRLLQQLLKSRSEAQSYLDKLSHTLLHQDLWLPNIGRWGDKTVLIDWTNMGVGPPGIDVCQLCFYLMQTDLKFDPQSLIEMLYLALTEDWGIAISYRELLKSYELAFCLRPVSILGACILRDILNGNTTMTGVTELEQKLSASESIFQWIERGARYLAG